MRFYKYIKKLETESTLSYDDDLSKILINLNSLVAQDLIRFLTSFPDKKILLSKYCLNLGTALLSNSQSRCL